MMNPVQPQACTILNVKKESRHEWTFRVATDAKPAHGQFMQLSIPMIGEAPISVSAQDDGWLEFTIRSVGKVTNVIFQKQAGDTLFLRGPYGKGWPVEQFRDKHLVVITGGTGLAPVRSMLNMLAQTPGYARSVHLICGFKNADGIVFHSELEEWKKHFSTIYTLDNGTLEGWRTGMVTAFVPEIPFDSFGGDYAVVVVGPPPMMKFTGLALMDHGVEAEKVWMSFERKMSCAVGKCGHCRIDEVYVCLDGPVFPYPVARDLVD